MNEIKITEFNNSLYNGTSFFFFWLIYGFVSILAGGFNMSFGQNSSPVKLEEEIIMRDLFK